MHGGTGSHAWVSSLVAHILGKSSINLEPQPFSVLLGQHPGLSNPHLPPDTTAATWLASCLYSGYPRAAQGIPYKHITRNSPLAQCPRLSVIILRLQVTCFLPINPPWAPIPRLGGLICSGNTYIFLPTTLTPLCSKSLCPMVSWAQWGHRLSACPIHSECMAPVKISIKNSCSPHF